MGSMLVPRRILVVRLSALGDVLFTLPAVEAMLQHRPDLEVDWLVEDRAATILDLYPRVHRRLVYPRAALSAVARNPLRGPRAVRALWKHLRSLRSREYDAVLDFQGNLKSGVHARVSRGVRRLGFGRGHARELGHLFTAEHVDPQGAVHRVDRALALARALFPDLPPEAPCPALSIPESSTAAMHEGLRRHGLDTAPFVVLHPGTSQFGAFKRWPPDRFSHLGDLLAREGQRVVVTFGPGERELAGSVARGMKTQAGLLSPETRSVADLAAVLARARLMVGSDSAPLHLAAFLGTPVAALFGPKDPAIYGPRFARSREIRTYLPCSPCRRRTCPDILCMREISVRQVFEASRELLASSP